MSRLPADRGLSGLALVMQLGGGISAAFLGVSALVYWVGFKPMDTEFGTKLLLRSRDRSSTRKPAPIS